MSSCVYFENEEMSNDDISCIINDFGTKIKLYRVYSGITQEELSKISGVSQRTISRLENGESVQFDNIIRIMCSLKLKENVQCMIPDQRKRPIYYLDKENNVKFNSIRQRVKNSFRNVNEFKWGDEQ